MPFAGLPLGELIQDVPSSCWLAVGAAAVIAALVALVALLSPPNTTDAMHYHLPRIVHWLQNRNVGYWPTVNYKQLYLSPGAEYLVVHLHSLTGGDTLDNLVQWFSMVASAIGVSLIARELGATLPGQAFASLISITIPEGILESSGSKNDYTVTLWLVALAYYLLVLRRDKSWWNTILIAASLGLSYLTKTTAVLFAPWIVLCIFLTYDSELKRLMVKRAGAMLGIALLLNAPPMARNLRAIGSLSMNTTVPGNCNFINQPIGIKCTISNIARNLGLQIETPSAAADIAITAGLKKALGFFGIAADDPGCTWCASPFNLPELSAHEAGASNTLHLLLIAACIITLTRRLKPISERLTAKLFALSLLLCALTFCVLMTWQPWHTRLHLPMFVLGSALAGAVICDRWPKSIAAMTMIVLIVGAAPFALGNEIRPLIFGGNVFDKTRDELYFNDRGVGSMFLPYQGIANLIKKTGCKNIGLEIRAGGYEYPMLALLDGGYRNYVVRQMPDATLMGKVANDMRDYSPCAVICFSCSNQPSMIERYRDPYTEVSTFGDNLVFTRARGVAPSEPITVVGAVDGWILPQGVSLLINPAIVRQRPRIVLRGAANSTMACWRFPRCRSAWSHSAVGRGGEAAQSRLASKRAARST